jgi:transmembrane sensor
MPVNTDEASPTGMQQAVEWLILLRSGELSETETHAFADWLSQETDHAEAFAKAEDVFGVMVVAATSPRAIPSVLRQTNEPVSKWATSPEPKQIKPERHPASSNHSRWLTLPLALAAAWLFAVTLIMPTQSHWLDDTFSNYHTSTGELRDIQLADGSRLLLNTNTSVSVDYQPSVRLITLHHGQARFTVAKDTQRPFEVASDGLVVRALGTVFEVYHSGSGETSVTVQEHAVAARIQSEGQTSGIEQSSQVDVPEGYRLRYGNNGQLGKPEPVDVAQTSAWQHRRLYINNRPLTELVTELGRYRTGRIFLSDTNLKNLRVTGVFSLANPEEALIKVCKALGLQETRLGPWWVVLHR